MTAKQSISLDPLDYETTFVLADPVGDYDAYVRLSKKKDGKLADVDVQLRNVVKDMARIGRKLRAVWIDNGKSAWDPNKKRPGFLAMLAAMKRGDLPDAVAAVDMDRFVRQTGETDALIVLSIQTETAIYTGGSVVDLSTPMAVGMAKISGVLGEIESATKSGRIKRAHAEIADQGRFHGGRRPFGYEKDGVTPHAVEADLYRELIRRTGDGETLRSIANDWHARGIVGPSGKPFDSTRLRYLVISPRHVGQKVHKGKVVGKAVWDGLVTPNEQARAIAQIKSRNVARAPRSGPDRKALLQGIMFCGKCGTKLRIGRKSAHGREHLYRCPSIGGTSCGGLSVLMRLVDKDVEQRFFARLTDPKVRAKLAKQQAAAPDVTALLGRIDQIDADLAMLRDMLAADEIDRDEFRQSVKTLTAAKKQARTDLDNSSLPIAITTDPDTLIEKWDSLLDDERRANLAAVVERIEVVGHLGTNRKVWNPERVKVFWKDAAS